LLTSLQAAVQAWQEPSLAERLWLARPSLERPLLLAVLASSRVVGVVVPAWGLLAGPAWSLALRAARGLRR